MVAYLLIVVPSFALRDNRKCNFLYSGRNYVFLDDEELSLIEHFITLREGYSGRYRVLNADMRCSLWVKSDNLVYGGVILASHVFNYHVVDSIMIGDYFITCLTINAYRQCLLVVSSHDEGFIGSKCDDVVNSSPEMAQLMLSIPEILWG